MAARPAPVGREGARLGRLVLLVGAVVLVDTMFYAAITPLLPYYSDREDLSKSAAGVLAAAYPAGTLLGALPGGWLAARAGVRPTVLLGLGLMSGSSLVFGLAQDIVLLDLARFVQGLGGAASWAGALSWLVRAAPAERRGELIGTAFGAAIGGALLGPVLGAAAREAGTVPVFSTVAGIGLVLALAAALTPAPAGAAGGGGPGASVLRDARVRAGVALTVLVGLFFGLVEVLAPLRLDELGAGGALVGATFLVGAALQAVASPLEGRWLDRAGAFPLARAGLAGGVPLAVLLGTAEELWLLVGLVVLAEITVGLLWVPGMTLVSRGAEARGLDQGYGFALVNLAWAGAQVAGAGAGARLAQETADLVPYGVVAALFGLGLVVATRPRAA